MYNLKLRHRHVNRQAIMNSICLDDIQSDDEWVTEKEELALPRQGDWLRILERNTQHEYDSDLYEDEVEGIVRNLEKACKLMLRLIVFNFIINLNAIT